MAGYYIPLVGTPQIGDSGGGGGGGAGGLLVNVTQQGDASVCDKTAGEMAAVIEAGGGIVFKSGSGGHSDYELLISATIMPDSYTFSSRSDTYSAATADDYPSSGGK